MKKETTHQHRVPPLHVDGRREDVPDELSPLLGHVGQVDVDLTTLGHDPGPVLLQVFDQGWCDHH